MLFDFEWWMSVVVAGFVVGIASAYAKSGIDQILGLFFKVVRLRLEKGKKKFNDRVEYLLNNPLEAIQVRIDKVYHAVICLLSIIITLVFLTSMEVTVQHRGGSYLMVYGIIGFIVPILAFVAYIYHLMSFLEKKDLLGEVNRRKQVP